MVRGSRNARVYSTIARRSKYLRPLLPRPRRDVEHRQRSHAFGEIARQAMTDARAAVMADDMEGEEAERLHDLRHVERHGALRIVGMARQPARLGGAAIAA